MIQIKSFFTDWQEVDKETAKRFVKGIMQGATAINYNEKIKYIEDKKLRGITVKELLEDNNE